MALDYRKGDRAMISLPLFHVGGLFVGVGGCLSAGTTIVIPGPAGARDPALVTNFWRIIEKYRLTHAGNVPTTLGALADIPVGGLRHLQPARHADRRLDLPAGDRAAISCKHGAAPASSRSTA